MVGIGMLDIIVCQVWTRRFLAPMYLPLGLIAKLLGIIDINNAISRSTTAHDNDICFSIPDYVKLYYLFVKEVFVFWGGRAEVAPFVS